jgi:hypothetical protein
MQYKRPYACNSEYTPSLEYRVTFADILVSYGTVGVGPCLYDSGGSYASGDGKKGPYEPG